MQIALGREPGSEWDYSGGDYLVLQLIIEEVSGQTYEAYMHSALLQPLANDSGPLPSASNETMREPNADLFGLDFWGLGTILYTNTDSGNFIYGHDGQNEPAINSAIRINPDNGDEIIVFASGNKSLATLIGFEWVLWQTGKPDLLGIGYVIDDGVRILTG